MNFLDLMNTVLLGLFLLVASANCQVTDHTTVSVGDRICFEGFVMDNFCISRGTLFDEPTTRTLERPERHSVHCLIDVPQCYSTNFELLAAPTGYDTMYSRAFQLTDEGKAGIIAVAASVGAPNPQDSIRCSECTGEMGSLGRGFRAMVYGIVIAPAQANGIPATIHVVDAVATHDMQGSEFCTGDFPTEQNLAFGQPIEGQVDGEAMGTTETTTTTSESSTTTPTMEANSTAVAPVDAPMGVTDPSTVAVGDNICFEGFVMDNFCIERGTLLDRSSVRTLIGPEQHSVHCLIDISACRNSNYELLKEPAEGEIMYTRAFQFDGASKEGIINIAAAVSSTSGCARCTAESGMLRQGFRAEVYGVVTELTDPPTIQIVDAVASNNLDTSPCMRTTMPEQNREFAESAAMVGEKSMGSAEVAFMAIAFIAVAALGVLSVFGNMLFPKNTPHGKTEKEPAYAQADHSENI